MDREILLDQEFKWLSFINEEELGKKYYNLRKHKWGHWSTDVDKRLTIGQKISSSPDRKDNISKANKGKKRSESFKDNLKQSATKQWQDPVNRHSASEKSKQLWQDENYVKKVLESRNKTGITDSMRQARSENMKRINKLRWNKTTE